MTTNEILFEWRDWYMTHLNIQQGSNVETVST
jgi:hypothetical protein